MTGEMPICETCKHLFRDEKGYSCKAFPNGIPAEISTGENDHHEPFEGDNGVVYEPLDE